MRKLAFAAALCAAVAGPAAGAELFPATPLVRPLVADPAAPRSFVSLLRARTAGERLTIGSVGFGTDFGLVRWGGPGAEEGWQTGVFGAVFSQFNLSAPSDDLINTDFVIGVPLAFRRGPFAARARLWHQSSHLGDELILSGGLPTPRSEHAIDVLDGLLSWQLDGWRLYGGGRYAFGRDPRELKRRGWQAGVDYVGEAALVAGGRPVAGIDVKWLEQFDWDAGVSVKAGLQFGRPRPERRGVTVLLETYEGFAPFGQFLSEEVRYYGLALQFDF